MADQVISVVIPVYNARQSLERCVHSVIGQCYSALEVILVDDGSTDGSGPICDQLAATDSRIQVIHKPNGGVSSARNKGIEVATGEYLQFVDCDDWLHPQMCQLLLEAIAKNGADMALCGYQRVVGRQIDEVSPIPSFCSGPIDFQKQFEKLYSAFLINPPWNKLYRRALVASFSQGISLGEDLLFNLAYLKKSCKIEVITDCPYFYVAEQPGSLTKRYQESRVDWELVLYKETTDFLQEVFGATYISSAVREVSASALLADIVGYYANSPAPKQQKRDVLAEWAQDPGAQELFWAVGRGEISVRRRSKLLANLLRRNQLAVASLYLNGLRLLEKVD
ncbi:MULTISPECIES: glycosyltransferase family 2 protein [Eubacteriales]|uniref:Glycosyl transferase family 2 n=1 Tax=Bittarella massiliensis (ex Durand et al. 2017) TaxID=1720313 RepID=A0AAQ1MCX3_9FIRM|nr:MULTISPECIES: glycosyltransferase family 2 protein [Eubacteriales]MZL70665.1 glycosyltransferase [Bittarella massiliensis (ex Durand et al. 2017)]MZL81337.1 glycosyltransferase [Bittarella massiliensis (ex Durand et al. 2017)]SHG05268.1 Glycosyl transferase family 2 [Bittarella massiliensis (ex Durand et al. 2017)]